MPIYSVNASPTAVTAPSTSTAEKVFDTNTAGRQGYSICNPSGSVVYVQEVPAGAAAPTAAAVVAAPSAVIAAGGLYPAEAGSQVDVYVAVASGTASVTGQELL